MASFKNRIVVPKNKTAFTAHIDHIKAGSGNQVSHAPCMSHRIIEVLKELRLDRVQVDEIWSYIKKGEKRRCQRFERIR